MSDYLFRASRCDKCGEPGDRAQDITMVEAMAFDEPITTYAYMARHIRCSPSRAQYILVEPYGIPDARPQYDKRIHEKNGLTVEVAERERQFTAGYRKLLESLAP